MPPSDRQSRPSRPRWPSTTSRSAAQRAWRAKNASQVSAHYRLSMFWKALLGGVVAIAAAITSISAALYIVLPDYAPREKLGAQVDRISVAQGVPYDVFKLGQGYDEESYQLDDPKQDGLQVLVHATVSGYKSNLYSVRVDLYDAETYLRISPEIVSGTLASECEARSPSAQEDSVAFRCWLVAPPEGTKYIVRAELHDAGPTAFLGFDKPNAPTVLLDFIDSQPFASLGVNVYDD